ncbi:MAG TPA: DUF364 domain-containing protein [Magnetospirillaceae bacterium]|nr:DUF364 domain-containing protein [Magnetospirillaceae bacterium]
MENRKVMDAVLAAAGPFLEGKTVRDLVIGVSMIGCQLDDGSVGVSYMPRDELPHGCSTFPYAQDVIGAPAVAVAGWMLYGGEILMRAISSAVLSAAAAGQDLPDEVAGAAPHGVRMGPGDAVGLVGYIAPLARQIRETGARLSVFDRGGSDSGLDDPGTIEPDVRQGDVLPHCDVVFLSGTTTVNGSVDGLLGLCGKAREIVIVGASTPLFPDGWRGSRVTRLAGSLWRRDRKEEIFRLVSLAAGIQQLRRYMVKKNATVPPVRA